MPRQQKARDEVVYVGSQKRVGDYIPACLQAIRSCGEVVVKSRGRAIVNAVDVVEVLRNRYLRADIVDIEIGTEELEDGKRLSSIAIKLKPA